MLNRQFLGSKVGAAAIVSIAAMVAFNIFALSYQLDHQVAHQFIASAMLPVELA